MSYKMTDREIIARACEIIRAASRDMWRHADAAQSAIGLGDVPAAELDYFNGDWRRETAISAITGLRKRAQELNHAEYEIRHIAVERKQALKELKKALQHFLGDDDAA